ncbi:MAG TPA: T9SS type A sorting domain-containing protein [Flavipsychrobacter sp.]|nr:T9SS type A sorting domain-containing protein [Flavipsychrobacter sp.]
MKRYAIVLALCATTSAYGQRLIDLEFKLTAPTPNTTVNSNVAFTTGFTVKNVGTTTLKATDSIAWFYTLDGKAEDYDNDGQPDVFVSTGTQLAPNATITGPSYSITYTIPASLNGTTHQYGIGGIVLNRSLDSAKDNNIANNTSSNPIIFGTGTSSVSEVKGSIVKNRVLSVYPNPAVTEVHAKIDLGATNYVSYRLTDITGRTVVSGDKDRLSKGEHVIRIALPDLMPGLYFFHVVVGDAIISTDKLYITK